MKGLGTSVGIGIGKVLIYKEPEIKISKNSISDSEQEIERLNQSIHKAIIEIDNIYNITLEKVGEPEAEIFAAHKMILEDPEYISAIKEKILTDNVNSEWAVREITNSYISLFQEMEDEYLRARAVDIKDVSDRMLRILLNIETKDLSLINRETIIVARDLNPSDTAQINKDMVVGIVTEIGGRTSHTSIMARTMNIPAICGVKDITDIVKEDDLMIINGSTGDIIVNPTVNEVILYRKEKEDLEKLRKELEKLKGQESISKDGYKVELAGNIGTLQDIDKVIENDGEGVGLYRTEFLYMYNDKLPTEEEQFEAYKIVAERLKGKPLVIRTLDVGGDKDIPYLNIPKEMNPFLGYRAIRFCLDNEGIFITQIRAILRASAYGNVKIMFPMISNIEELRESKLIVEGVKEELRKENIEFNENIEIGIMVEIPAVAIHSRQFAKEVDFFSIGTNDLIQYTLAVDRGNQKISNLYNQFHPAILSLIKMTIDNGHKEGIWVGMCGEVAGDEKLIPILLAMGLDEFSMSASSILKARHLIRNTSKKEIEEKLDYILDLPTADEVEKYIDENIISNDLDI
ncbi:phosphoenolpyruvate--protein phosphotransferase [Tissierella carlieri]|uniref:phosphoenolpyruvate--protein phosphotransferase n=1 Tax=Tissierella carlieri TaxID=689904 RepID=UPI001C10405E|nr:phosphoenolpyruvate--protein phosphotransferase [uncultured Tissierella sp.]MBU5312091.1 phosphoenolpyruvate--protein phosphotransferase [Tissierella carlieri]MDU5080974.1 phosphoenolpyruvate--protein phosphotransferase [Bacillota bacterium]